MPNQPSTLVAIIDDLKALAMDLWWTTQPDAEALWSDLDPDLWQALNHNPVALLADVDLDRTPPDWEDTARAMLDRWQRYHKLSVQPPPGSTRVAYFCMEFGLHESLPIYSGGLGVLAGDHLRSASDLGMDLVGVGLFYSQGYFRQLIHDDRQVAAYVPNDPKRLPLQPALDSSGQQVEVTIPSGRHNYVARIWRVTVGRVQLYLLDTDYDANPEAIRQLTRTLYGGDSQTRLAQEVLLGLGGMRALRALGIERDTFHMNEGHAAFLVLDLWARELTGSALSLEDAWCRARQKCVFTTHTPVDAGHDRFPWHLIDPALVGFRERLGLPQGAFMDRARQAPGDLHEPATMTVLALKGSRAANGVSRLHGEISRQMWSQVDAPIGHITNGVHPTAWLGPSMARLFDARLPGWRDALCDRDFWQGVARISPSELNHARAQQRRRLIDAVRHRTGKAVLDHGRLTIGFARRFASYKRGTLLFSDPTRLRRLLDQGMQVIFAGKAHPADGIGQDLIHEILRWTRQPGFRGRVVFVPDYDMALGRLLTQGADVWLNNPRRPHEASGTSGQKAALNGGLNLSVLDGWWPEAWDGSNGWAIGTDQLWDDPAAQDANDADSLYRSLEDQVLPTWADARAWAAAAAASIATCMPVFNSNRMVRDYAELMYRPGGAQRYALFGAADSHDSAAELLRHAAPDPRLTQPRPQSPQANTAA